MPYRKINKEAGFTIVELLVVIIVILAAVSIGAYNQLTTRALNSSRHQELKQYVKLFELYRSSLSVYPTLTFTGPDGASPANGACLGSGFPDGVCRDIGYGYPDDPNSYMNTELKKVGTLPSAIHKKAGGSTMGPWVATYATDSQTLDLSNGFDGVSGQCPADLKETFADASKKLLICAYNLKRWHES